MDAMNETVESEISLDEMRSRVITHLLSTYHECQIFFEPGIEKGSGLSAKQTNLALLDLKSRGIIEPEAWGTRHAWKIVRRDLRAQQDVLEIRRFVLAGIVGLGSPADPVALCEMQREKDTMRRHVDEQTLWGKGKPRTPVFIQSHCRFLTALARLSGNYASAQHISVIQDQLSFARTVYPDDLTCVAADAENIHDSVVRGVPPAELSALVNSHLKPFENRIGHLRGHLAMACDAEVPDAARLQSTAECVRLCWPLVRRATRENTVYRRALPADLDMDAILSDVASDLCQLFQRYGKVAPGRAIDAECNIALLVLATAVVTGHLLIPEEKRSVETAALLRALISKQIRQDLTYVEYMSLLMRRLRATFEQTASRNIRREMAQKEHEIRIKEDLPRYGPGIPLKGYTPYWKEGLEEVAVRKGQDDTARLNFNRARERIKKYLPLPFLLLIEDKDEWASDLLNIGGDAKG